LDDEYDMVDEQDEYSWLMSWCYVCMFGICLMLMPCWCYYFVMCLLPLDIYFA